MREKCETKVTVRSPRCENLKLTTSVKGMVENIQRNEVIPDCSEKENGSKITIILTPKRRM